MKLDSVIPWGRNMAEYKAMFSLTEYDINKKILSCGDGPASFNFEMTKLGKSVTSLDPIYQFGANELKSRFEEVKDIVIQQVKKNKDLFIWKTIKDVVELENIRMSAMNNFIVDFEEGKEAKRYLFHELPNKTKFTDNHFDLGLSSHFLLLYSELGLDFHIKSISEMLRVCKEVRIFPLLNLESEKSEVLDDITRYFNSDYILEIKKVKYEFQVGGNKMLTFRKKQ